MALYRYKIKPTSTWATPLRSDTLYGHLLWKAAQWQGAAAVEELIDAFAGDDPPFRLSSGFPAGCLPMPSLPSIPRQRFMAEFRQYGDLVKLLQEYKKFRKIQFLDLRTWHKFADCLSQEVLFRHWVDGKLRNTAAVETESFRHAGHEPHNSIDRRSGSVLAEGGLHFTPVTWFGPQSLLDLYVESDDIALFEKLFGYLAQVGFGADRSIGKGQFTYERDDAFDGGELAGQGDHQMCLSICVTRDCSKFSGFWQPMVKHGRTWSGFGERNPFKKPFLAFTEGSLFHCMPATGYLLRNVHGNPRIVQITWPVTVPAKLEVNHAS